MLIVPLNIYPIGIVIPACGSCLPKRENDVCSPLGNPLSASGFGRVTLMQNASTNVWNVSGPMSA